MAASRSDKKIIGLVDFDGTAADPDGTSINEALIEALLSNGITEIYLFTTMTSGTLLTDIDIYAQNPEAITRPKLIEEFEKRGIKVRGVITPMDTKPEMKLGEAYEKHFNPGYDKAKKHIDSERKKKSPEVLSQDGQEKADAEIKTLFNLYNGVQDLTANAGYTETKGLMYEKLIKNPPDDVGGFIFIDDKPECYKGAEEADKKVDSEIKLYTAKEFVAFDAQAVKDTKTYFNNNAAKLTNHIANIMNNFTPEQKAGNQLNQLVDRIHQIEKSYQALSNDSVGHKLRSYLPMSRESKIGEFVSRVDAIAKNEHTEVGVKIELIKGILIKYFNEQSKITNIFDKIQVKNYINNKLNKEMSDHHLGRMLMLLIDDVAKLESTPKIQLPALKEPESKTTKTHPAYTAFERPLVKQQEPTRERSSEVTHKPPPKFGG